MNSYIAGCARQNISPSTQWTDYGLRTVKTYNNTESHAKCKEDSWKATDGSTEGCNQWGTFARSGQTPVWGLRRQTTMLRVVLREPKVPVHSRQNPVWGLWKDRWHAKTRIGQERESWYTTDSYAHGCPHDTSSTQWKDFGLRAVKTDGNA